MALTWPLEQQGSTGENVKTVQYLVTAQGYATGVDGAFGPQTKAAVQAFQSAHGLGADGIVGPQTWPALIIQVKQGSDGAAVRAVQSQIHSRGDGASQVAVDGIFGPATEAAVQAFQDLLGLSVDGIVGPQTWNHLVNGYLAAPGPVTAARDVFSAWQADDRGQAALNATADAVDEIFAQAFSAGDGWSFQGSSGATGHIISVWQRANGRLLEIDVQNAVEGPYYVARSVQFT